MESITKLRLLYLYRYLTEHTDESHMVSTAQLISMLKENYQIDVNRVTLGNDLVMLMEAGFPVRMVRAKQNQYYYEGALFDEDELKMMADAISMSPFIPKNKGQTLIKKLAALSSPLEIKLTKRNIFSPGGTRDDQLYRKMEMVNDAVNGKRRIMFQYKEYNAEKKQVLQRNGRFYVVSPYAIVWDGEYLYVVGHSQMRDKIQHFRLDRIHEIPTLMDDEIVPPPLGFKVETYVKSMVRMYGENLTDVYLKCANYVMNSLVDHFGLQMKVHILDEGHFIVRLQVRVSPTFYRWVFGWGGDVSIMGPEYVAQEYRKMCRQGLE